MSDGGRACEACGYAIGTHTENQAEICMKQVYLLLAHRKLDTEAQKTSAMFQQDEYWRLMVRSV